jgi:multiple sugar transport system permease protein
MVTPTISLRIWRAGAIAPMVLFYLLLTLLPLFNLAAMSFSDVSWVEGGARWRFVGLANLASVLSDHVYHAGVLNTAWFSTISVSIQMVFLLPILMPGIVIGAIWKLMYDSDFGVINQLLTALGGRARDWTGSPDLAMAAIIAVDVWHWTPFVFLLMLAGIESLPQDVFEAARVDATPWWRELMHITLPLMAPTIVVTLVFRIVMSFKVFDEIYLLTSGGPGTATEVVSFSIYRTFFVQGRVGQGSAVSLVTMLLVAVLIVLTLNLQARAARRPR